MFTVLGKFDDPSLTLEHPQIEGIYRANCNTAEIETAPTLIDYTGTLGGGFFNGKTQTTVLRFDPQHDSDPCDNTDASRWYYIAISGSGDATGSYRVLRFTVHDDQDWTFGPDTTYGSRIAVTVDGPSKSALLDYELDYDWFEFQAEAGERYDLALDALTHPKQIFGLHQWVEDDDEFQRINAPSRFNSKTGIWSISFTAERAGTHIFAVRNGFPQQESNFKVWVKRGAFPLPPIGGLETSITSPDLPANRQTLARLIVNPLGSTLERLTSGLAHAETDEDWYAMRLEAGHLYRFWATAVGTLTIDTLAIHDNLGYKIPGAVDADGLLNGPTHALLFQPQESGLHYLSIALDKDGGSDNLYRFVVDDLSVAPGQLPGAGRQ